MEIVAEVGLAHDGSLGNAHAYIEAVAKAGADAVKFQCHIPEAESWPDEPWRIEPEWPQDKNRFDYWARTAFTREQWSKLAAHAELRGIEFLCSPFSVEAVEMLSGLVRRWKVPSGEITNRELLEAIKATGKRAILSTGMATERELINADSIVPAPLWLQCTSCYPCPAGKIGLAEIPKVFDGLSDHSGTIYPGLAAAALGAELLEVHVCWSKQQWGFDTSSSITIDELKRLVEGVRFIEKALTPVDKDEMAKELEPMRRLFMDRHKRRVSA